MDLHHDSCTCDGCQTRRDKVSIQTVIHRRCDKCNQERYIVEFLDAAGQTMDSLGGMVWADSVECDDCLKANGSYT